MRNNISPDNRHENNCTRRRFLGYAGGALAAGSVGSLLAEDTLTTKPVTAQRSPLIWGNLLHLSFNMWSDREFDWGPGVPTTKHLCCRNYLRCDDKLWAELTQRMADAKMNMVVIDLGDAIQYQSHPEIAVKNAWSLERLRNELARLRKMGLEPIPKLNFSTAHDVWLGPYARQISTPVYYKVCEDLIDEVIRLFGKPRLFHLGYDEETAECQSGYAYSVVRQHELWWHDFEFFTKQVERRGVRPWIWSDFAWKHGDEFLKRMPRSVMQSNWCYELDFKDDGAIVRWYGELDRHGYDQIPTGSNWSGPQSFGLMVDYCKKKIISGRMNGFLQTTWMPTLDEFRQRHIEAIDQVAKAMG